MARNKQKNKKKPAGKARRPAPRPGMSLARAMVEYDNLIRDPCAAPLTHPPYLGTGTGYLCRTVENIRLADKSTSGLTVGNKYIANACFALAPGNYTTTGGFAYGGGVTATIALAGSSVFPVTSSAVKRYRPVACCVKWIPYGNYADRQGVVGLSYSPSSVMSSGDVVSNAQLLAGSMDVSPNGSKQHEIRWLPTVDDQGWIAAGGSVPAGAGTIVGVLTRVDGIAEAADTVVLNGYVEVTIVWEWTPSGYAAGLAYAPIKAPAFTINDHQRTIGDIGRYLLDGVRNASAAVTTGVLMGLTRGYGQQRRAAPSMAYLT